MPRYRVTKRSCKRGKNVVKLDYLAYEAEIDADDDDDLPYFICNKDGTPWCRVETLEEATRLRGWLRSAERGTSRD
jgi:hypothetical protein